ncbi:MAG TPA: HAMP domain-containing protein [Thiolapillus brandeum]|uniref:histidine kinase n=1 Tax=Thiolapillus brandeum TaxID=1076588 RepID=A0A7C5N385_9GAMM|nr:HAMP domain-containing protein [Thiolapillus brandeum]
MNSLHARLLLAASLVVAVALAFTALALDRAYRAATLAAQQEKLQSQVYALLAAADVGEGGRMVLPEGLPEPRLNRPGSGLHAWVLNDSGKLFWRSASLLDGAPPVTVAPLASGQRRFRLLDGWLVLSHGIEWEDDAGKPWPFTIVVAEARAGFDRSLARFRATLWRWLGGLAAGLLLIQLLVLRWGLAPLRRLEKDLEKVRAGERSHLEEAQPAELRPLAVALNRLLDHGRASLARYRNSLDDLAHNLKTPLAYLRSLAEDEATGCNELRRATREQVDRMEATVRQQLDRAAASGRSVLAGPVAVAPPARRLLAALERVYRDKGMAVEKDLDPAASFAGDEGDLMELLGNLLDNAFKYGRDQVRLSARCDSGLVLLVEDDGPGIPEPLRSRLPRRGRRLDQGSPGQGLGLAASGELVALYEGELTLGKSPLGGLQVKVRLPGCGSD